LAEDLEVCKKKLAEKEAKVQATTAECKKLEAKWWVALIEVGGGGGGGGAEVGGG
jgi:hypothetical protein